MPAISVVIPLYNKRAYILRCLESVCCQTLQDFEVIVVNDGSTDGSGEVAATFPDSRVRVVHQENCGVGAARNRGINDARGELVAFLDADDEWAPEFLTCILDLFRQYPEAGIFATGFRRCMIDGYPTETTLVPPVRGYARLISDYLQVAMRGNFITSSSAAVRRGALLEMGGFPVGEPFGEDRELWVRIGLRYSVAFDVRILAIYHSEADGRACQGVPRKLPYPPAVRTLMHALKDPHVPVARARGIHAYIDLLRIQYAYWQVAIHERSGAIHLLRETYFTRRFRIEAAALRCLLKVLPMRVITALREKPKNAVTRVARLFGRSQVARRGDLVIRQVPSSGV